MANKLFAVINAIGLSVGIAISSLILLYIAHEYNFDSFRPNAELICRIWSKSEVGGKEYSSLKASPILGIAIKKSHSGIKEVVRIYSDEAASFSNKENNSFKESHFAVVDQSYFKVFNVPLLQGNLQTVFDKPLSLVLSQSAAKKYFNTDDPIGKVLLYNDTLTFTVTGIMPNPPSNSVLQYDLLTSIESFRSLEIVKRFNQYTKTSALNSTQLPIGNFETYVLVENRLVIQQIPSMINRLISQELNGKDTRFIFFTQPFTDIHLGNDFEGVSNSRLVKSLSIVAIMIIALAIMNYVCLTTAYSSLRAKEVGIRKMSGASNKSLIVRFYGESLVFTFICFIIGGLLFFFLRPLFLFILEQRIDDRFTFSKSFLIIVVVFFIIVSLISGSYPALLLSSFSPVESLKSKYNLKTNTSLVRNLLIIFQFVISAVLINCNLVIKKQLDFLKNENIGLRRSDVLVLPFKNSIGSRLNPYINTIRNLADVEEITVADVELFRKPISRIPVVSPVTSKEISMGIINADITFVNFFGLNFAKIHNSQTFLGAPNTVLINEAASNAGGVGEGSRWSLFGHSYETIGIVKDFNYVSLYNLIEPVFIFLNGRSSHSDYFAQGGCIYIRLRQNTSTNKMLTTLKKIYQDYDKETSFDYYFLDDAFNNYHKAENRLSNFFFVITAIAIIIASLGLIALSIFTAQQRTREVGVRKVLGASQSEIIFLLSQHFLKLILIAILISLPVTLYVSNNWLNNFSYKIEFPWLTFFTTGSLILIIASVSTYYQLRKIANVNPVQIIRNQ